jgi:hypothetical protein
VVHDEDILDSDDDVMDNNKPHSNAPPPCIRKNTPLLYESLMASHHCLKQRHATTRPDLKYLKLEHQSIVKELHSLKSMIDTLDNKLECADDIEMELEVVMLDVETDMIELEDVKSKLSNTQHEQEHHHDFDCDCDGDHSKCHENERDCTCHARLVDANANAELTIFPIPTPWHYVSVPC